MKIHAFKPSGHALRVSLLAVWIVSSATSAQAKQADVAAERSFWSECGVDASRCSPAVIARYYKEYLEKVVNLPGRHERELELMAGGRQAIEPLLKAFLSAGYEIRAQDVQDFARDLYNDEAIWLYTGANFEGLTRECKTDLSTIPQNPAYRSVRLGRGVYLEVFSEPQFAGSRRLSYSSLSNLPASNVQFSPRSVKLHRRAKITVSRLYSIHSGEGSSRPVIGMAAQVSLENLRVDIAADHHGCDAPCDDPGCAPTAGFFFDLVYSVYDPGAQGKSWYDRHPMELMINTSYFKICAKGGYHHARCGNTSGLFIQGGVKLLGESVPDDFGNLLDAIVFWKDGRVDLFRNRDIPRDLKNAEVALGGNWFFTGEEYHCQVCHDPDQHYPRTALGLDGHNRALTIVVVQPGHDLRSEGVTGPELQALMRKMGVERGFMLDGGGSSQFVYIPEGAEAPETVLGGDREGYRPVPSAFGIVGLKDAP